MHTKTEPDPSLKAKSNKNPSLNYQACFICIITTINHAHKNRIWFSL